MNIVDQGLNKRMEDVMKMVDKESYVMDANQEISEVLSDLQKVLGDCDLMYRLDSAIGNYGFVQCEASYRVGLSDGMQLQQEINAIAKRP